MSATIKFEGLTRTDLFVSTPRNRTSKGTEAQLTLWPRSGVSGVADGKNCTFPLHIPFLPFTGCWEFQRCQFKLFATEALHYLCFPRVARMFDKKSGNYGAGEI